MNKTATNTRAQVFVRTSVFFPSGEVSESLPAGSYGKSLFSLENYYYPWPLGFTLTIFSSFPVLKNLWFWNYCFEVPFAVWFISAYIPIVQSMKKKKGNVLRSGELSLFMPEWLLRFYSDPSH